MKIYAVSHLCGSWHVHVYDERTDYLDVLKTEISDEDAALLLALHHAGQNRPSEVREIFANGDTKLVAHFDALATTRAEC